MDYANRKPVLGALLACLLALALALTGAQNAKADEPVTSVHPLLDPKPVPHVETEDEFFNILLLGIDYGMDDYWGSGTKKTLENCHTDAVMVISINRTDNSVSLVSLPRDTLTYVPDVRGVYKLNAAINCAVTVEEGIGRTMDAVTWLLGGIQIDRYCAVDMSSMIALGDAIGGVDFEVDMSYQGHSGRHYKKGMQHLDGQGIMDYIRARTNATVDHNDIGRTRRQRAMMTAIFEKVKKENVKLLSKLMEMMQGEDRNIFTNLSLMDITTLMPIALGLNAQDVGSYVLTGPYKLTLTGWNFTFTDQDNRLSVLKEVYGIDAETIPYVSFEHAEFLTKDGLSLVRFIRLARGLIDECEAIPGATAEQTESLQSLIEAHNAAVAAFEQAANTLSKDDVNAMLAARTALRNQGDATAKAFGVTKVNWEKSSRFCDDELVNEYNHIRWR